MNNYELLYIISNELSDEAKEAVIAKFSAIITDNGGTVDSVDKWGTRKLAYAINYKTEGYYVLMSFESDVNLIAELKRVAGITDGILRRLITKA
jgi:small subunit ribosomal protein S6